MIGSHSAEEIAISAKANGFETLVFCQKGREKFYQHYNKHLYDHVIVLDKFKEILHDENQTTLEEKDTVTSPILQNRINKTKWQALVAPGINEK